MSEASDVFWLNFVNAVLGLVTLACVLAMSWAVAADLLAWWRRERVKESERHLVHLPDLGAVMADGGERLDGAPPEADTSKK